MSKDDEVLEIGCASGYFLDTIKKDVLKVYGVELDDVNREYCKRLDIETQRNINDFDKKFDKVFLFHVLEHIRNPITFLNDLKKYLRKDGLLFIEVPNLDDPLLSIFKLQEYSDFYYQKAHIWYFNRKSLEYLLNKCNYNYNIINIQRYNLSNHLNWLNYRKPGGNKYYDEIFDDSLMEIYKENLVRIGKTDTLFAICSCK